MKNSVKRSLIFQFTLNEEMKAKYKLLCKGKKKSILEIMRGKLMRKYKLLGRASNEFCVSGGTKRNVKGSLSLRLRKQVQAFYERDDISRLTSGIRETITRQGEKRQKRILNDTIEKIHERYLLENTEQKIS